MALQSQNLVMVGLEVWNDQPPNDIQPPLANGVHLRWAFKRSLGFPWYGFYLFRRLHPWDFIPLMLSSVVHQQPGTLATNILPTILGEVSSDQNLVLTDGFPPAGSVEFDLGGRQYLRFTLPEGETIRWAKLTIGFRSTSDPQTTIQVTALLEDTPVAQVSVTGPQGQSQVVSLEFDAITAIELSGGSAALVDLGIALNSRDATAIGLGGSAALVDLGIAPNPREWMPVANLQQPIGLPVTHPDYPCTGGRPTDLAEDEALALSRIRYGHAGDWSGAPFTELHDRLLELVVGGPGSTPMADRSTPVSGVPDPPDPGIQPPTIPALHPLDMVLLGSLHPAVAQMLGLYWVDDQEVVGEPWFSCDYMVVADPSGIARGSLEVMQELVNQNPLFFTLVDCYIVYGKRPGRSAPALPAPEDLRVYALPGASVRVQDGSIQDSTNNAGLRWKRDVTDLGILLPGQPAMYHLWRADLGNADAPAAPGAYTLLTKDQPVLVTGPQAVLGKPVQYADDWPPFSLHFLDTGLADGWYSYQVSGIDIFGRYSPASASSAWYEWAPVPVPRPWYYTDPPGDSVIHPFAVRLLDTLAPPRPTGVEAYALDPADPWVLKDQAYRDWWATLSPGEQDPKAGIIGLRVRWRWTEAHMRQAPDTHEFRVYLQPGQLNALPGRTTSVSAASNAESSIETDISNALPTDAYAGAVLQVGTNFFPIVGSDASNPLGLRVKNTGTIYTDGTISVSVGSPTVTGTGTSWGVEMAGLSLQVEGEPASYTVLIVNSPTQLTLDRTYAGATAAGQNYTIFENRPPANAPCTIIIGASHPLFSDYSASINWQERYYVVGYGEHMTVTTDGDGRPLRTYEVLLPAAGDAFRGGLSMPTSPLTPVAYAQVGVSAADDKAYISDASKWAGGRWGNRPGNEGCVSSPATIFRVHREPPLPPLPPPDAERVFATPTDYHSHSFYTYRWRASSPLKTHVQRALDDTLFQIDWALRPRAALAASQTPFFPDPAVDPRWDEQKRAQVADELNSLNSFAHDAAGTIQAMAYYAGLTNDALRILAGLPGNEAAFTQLTIRPLDPDDPLNADRRGPDSPDDYKPDPTLRAYLDTLDGRSTNRCFYRAMYVDGAYNRSALSLSGPPVWLPKVTPPRTPVITKALGGDRQIILRWASNREPDLAQYQVYRADSESSARDLRLMTLAHTEAVPAGDPAARPAEVEWTDTPVPGLATLYYRVVAMDDARNVSEPSLLVPARAYDTGA